MVKFLEQLGFVRIAILALIQVSGCSGHSHMDVQTCRTDDDCGDGRCSAAAKCVEETHSRPATDSGASDSEASAVEVGEAEPGTTSEVATETLVGAGLGTTGPVVDDAVSEQGDESSAPAEVDATPDGGVTASEAAVCRESCNELEYRVPGALCEDYRPDPRDWETAYSYEFCGAGAGLECPGTCEQSFVTVSAGCRQVLSAAVSCVTRDEFYRSGSPPEPGSCLLHTCTTELLTMASRCSGLENELTVARAKWNESPHDVYDFTFAKTRIHVEGDAATVVSGEELTPVPTIDALFDRIELSNSSAGNVTYAEFDPEHGFPARLHEVTTGGESCPATVEFEITDFTTTDTDD